MASSDFQVLVEIDALATYDVIDWQVDEHLGVPYRAELELETREDFDPETMRGSNLVLQFGHPGAERRVVGLITSVEVGRRQHGIEVAHALRLIVEPALAVLGLVRRTRIFQEKDVPTILDEVLAAGLGEYGRSVKLVLDGTYPTREHCVQYQESDLAFAERLMEEEGIAYSFEHDGATEQMVLTDANAAFQRAAGAELPLELRSTAFGLSDQQPILRFTRTHRATTTSVVIDDSDWSNTTADIQAESRSTDVKGRDRESYEHGWGRSATIHSYDAGARRYQEHDAAAQAERRRDAYLQGAVTGVGVSRVVGLRAGATFEIVGHPAVGLDGEYLLTRVRHEGSPAEHAIGEPVLEGATPEPYHNRFECIPLSVTHRPLRRAPKPRIPSVQTAKVTGPSGEEIHTDEHGRIKVQFHWDRDGAGDDTTSCWVRVQQKWAGAGWGFFWLPRVGMEVVVQFIDGDPDRPLVTGAVYDAANPVPYPLPDEKTKSTIKSSSTPGGAGFNELRFEDKSGSEEIYTHAQKDYNEVVEHNHSTLIHRHQTNEVDGNQTQTIHGNQVERVDGNQDLSVGGNRTVHVESSFDETVDGTESRTVTGDVSETFAANETRSVASNLEESFAANETRLIAADQTETIGGSLTQTIGGSSTVTVGGSSTNTIVGGVSLVTPGAWTVTAAGGMNITAPAGFTLLAPGGLQVGAPGGVQQVDTFRHLIASLVNAKGGSIRAATGFKNEYIAVHVSMVRLTAGVGGFHLCVGMKLSEENFKQRTGAAEGENNGVAVEQASADSK